MNDPRETVALGSLVVEAFNVNDERALQREVDFLQGDEAWADRPADERTAMVSLVRDALVRLAEDVEAWLPEAAVAETNRAFGFFVWWKNRHLDEEIIRQRVNAEHDDRERLLDLQRLAGQ
jgi:C4-dicarboxylate-specific signal transduction histidine kinase